MSAFSVRLPGGGSYVRLVATIRAPRDIFMARATATLRDATGPTATLAPAAGPAATLRDTSPTATLSPVAGPSATLRAGGPVAVLQ